MGEARRDWVGPPMAPVEPTKNQIHGRFLEDPYAWMRDRTDPRVEAYLEAENSYADAVMAHTRDFQDQLYREMLARIEETDMSVPYRKGSYLYFSRTEEGEQYPIYCRSEDRPNASEEVILDPNQLARPGC